MKKTQLTQTLIITLMILPLLVTSCGGKKEQSASDKVLEFANKLIKVIDEFEVARTKVLKVIDESAKNMEQYLGGNLSTKEKVDNYEKDWKKLANEVKAMDRRFNVIYRSSQSYFNQLYNLKESISNEKLKEQEQEKNAQLRRNWDKVYETAEEDVRKIKAVLQEGTDFHKVLLSSVMRAKINDNITQMKDISGRARRILKELSRFSIEGKKILKGNFTDYQATTKKSTNSGNKNKAASGEQPEPTKPTNQPTNVPTTLTEVKTNEVTASSYFAADGFVYKPTNAIDNSLKTWWSPKREDLVSNWLQLSFDQPQNIRSIEIHGGSHYPDFPKYGDIYRMNMRIKTAVLEFSDGSTETITLKDVDAIQEFSFSPRNTKYVILRAKTFYLTEKWEDLCVSHFKVFK
ncbi:MAG TPA: hypothetical protein DCS93_21375 [Microscillaceae bacterium]|nr:hypothetical protein [Microscillaceae bacterium]